MAMRFICPVHILLLALAALVLLVAAALMSFVWSPSARADPDANTYFFMWNAGPTCAPTYSFGSPGPNGVATDTAGNVYVTGPAGIAKFDSSGGWIYTYETDGGYTLSSCYGLDVDAAGYIYAANSANNCIVVLAPDSGGVNATSYHHLASVYTGVAPNQLDFPCDVAVDGDSLFVVDADNNRVQKLQIGADHSLAYLARWGRNNGDRSSGSGNGEFDHPSGIAADHAGQIFVTDGNNTVNNHRVQELTTGGSYVTQWGVSSPTSDPLYMKAPNGIDVDTHGRVYVSDFDGTTSCVDVFAPSGGSYQEVSRVGGPGTADAQFRYPWGVAVSPSGYLYVADTWNNKLKEFARDATGPAATVSGVPTGWARSDATVTLNASDPSVTGQYTSGMAAASPLQFSTNGGSTWQDYTAPIAVAAEGQTSIQYRATDAVGNVTTGTASVRIDKTAPTTTATGIPSGWSKKPVTIGLSGSDALSGTTKTEYSTNGGASWSTGASLTISTSGETKVQYRSVDAAGNVEAAKRATIDVDSSRPLPKALARCLVTHGKKMRLQYRVIDVSPKAKVRIEVYRGKKRLLRVAMGWKATNASLTCVRRCTLAPGMYTYKVYATDLAGNVQAGPGTAVLEVLRPR